MADQVTNNTPTQGDNQEQQVEFAEIAPTTISLLPNPRSVDMSYVESIRSFLTRPYPVLTGTWSGSQVYNTELSVFDPLKAYLNLPVISGKLQGFDYLRGGLRFEIRVNGTRFHYGQLVGAFLPLSGTLKIYDVSQANATALTMFPSAVVDPGPSQVGVFTVPFTYPRHFIRLVSSPSLRSLGQFRLRVLSPLRVVSQATVPTVSYAIYVSMVDPVVNATTAYPIASPLILEEQSADSAIRVIPENMNFILTDGNDTAIRAGMQGDNRVDNEEEVIGASREDMSFKKIFTMPNFIHRHTWTSALEAGSILFVSLVAPFIQGPDCGTYLSNITQLTQFWRGSLRYHVRIVASGFHSGRLLIGWDPENEIDGTAGITDISNRMHIVVDLQQTTDVYFTVPYMQPLPWSGMNGGINGILNYSVLNPLSTPSGEPTSVDVLVWMYGSDDLEFAMPATAEAGASPPQMLEEQCVVAPLNDDKFGTLAGSFSVPGKMIIGEHLSSVRDLMTKMAFGGEISTSAQTASVSLYSMTGPAPALTSHIRVLGRMYLFARGSLKYAAVMYSTSGRTTPVDEYQVGPDWNASTSSAPKYGALVVRGATPNAILKIPFYSNMLFYCTGSRSTFPDEIFPTYKMFTKVPATFTTWWYAAGPDFMLGYLIPPPFRT